MDNNIICGKIFALEGIDGSGKTTLFNKIYDKYGNKFKYVREPGYTDIAERVRDIVLSYNYKGDVTTDILLFAAARRSLYLEVITPLISEGYNIITDRSIVSSLALQTLEYNDIDSKTRAIDEILGYNSIVNLHDITVLFLDIKPSEAIDRLKHRGMELLDSRDSITLEESESKYNSYINTLNILKDKYDVDSLKIKSIDDFEFVKIFEHPYSSIQSGISAILTKGF